MSNFLTVSLPQDLPENWKDTQFVSPGGVEVGLTPQHGYNYLMQQVNRAQKGVKELDGAMGSLTGVNLLDNWYFANPVDRRKGHIVPPGTPYRTAMNNNLDDTGVTSGYVSVSKVNDDWGRIVVDGVDYYCAFAYAVRGYANSGFTIDRWQKYTAGTLLVGDGFITLKGGESGEADLVHTFLHKPAVLVGREATLSVLTQDGNLRFTSGVITDSTAAQLRVTLYEGDILAGYVYYLFDAAQNISGCVVNVFTGRAVNIRAVKLELNSQQTLASKNEQGVWVLKEIQNYPQEMSKCAQYDTATGVYMGSVPQGYIDGSISEIQSPADLDAKLDAMLASMPDRKVKFVIASFFQAHPVLGGGNRVFRIDKITSEYAIVHALGYTNEGAGVVLEHTRSKFNGTWTSWARNYNTFFKPTAYEIGAFGALSDASSLNLNEYLLMGCKRVADATNKPSGTGRYGLVWNIVSVDAVYLIQYYLDSESTKLYHRCRLANVWTSWLAEASTSVVPATIEEGGM